MHDAVLAQSVVCTRTQTQLELLCSRTRCLDLPRVILAFRATFITLLVAQLFILRSLASLVLVRVRVDRLVDRLGHLLLPALRYDQGKVLVQFLVTVQQLQDRETSVNMIMSQYDIL